MAYRAHLLSPSLPPDSNLIETPGWLLKCLRWGCLYSGESDNVGCCEGKAICVCEVLTYYSDEV